MTIQRFRTADAQPPDATGLKKLIETVDPAVLAAVISALPSDVQATIVRQLKDAPGAGGEAPSAVQARRNELAERMGVPVRCATSTVRHTPYRSVFGVVDAVRAREIRSARGDR